jgi:hypothetical protein
MAKRSDPKREAFWRRVLRRRAKSGMTVAEFCASEGLTEGALFHWQREIRRRDAERQGQDSDSADKPTFLPLQLVDDRSDSASVEIVTGNGYVIRVHESATTDHVRRVLLAVGPAD